MNRLLETICIENGIPQNIIYHNQRFNKSRRAFWPDAQPIDLLPLLKVPQEIKFGTVKCRVLYNAEIEEIQYMSYIKKSINRLKIVTTDIDYTYKWEDRKAIDEMVEANPYYDDILMVKNGYLTDTSYANIVFKRDNEFFTPQIPLLKGTKRQHLIDEDIIIEKRIKPSDLSKYSHFAIINAFNDLELTNFVPVKNIFK